MSTPVQLFAVNSLSSLGASYAETVQNLDACPLQDFLVSDSKYFGNTSPKVGEVVLGIEGLPDGFEEFDCRFSRLVYQLYLGIHEEVEDLKQTFSPERIGVVFGSSTSGVDGAENPFVEKHREGAFPESYRFFHQELGAGASLLSKIAGVKGPAYAISTACSSGGRVFYSGRRLLQSGLCDAVIVGGVDSLCKTTANGFDSLELISSGICNPMSKNRDGLNIGEGGSLFVLVSRPGGVQLRGVGESSDAWHVASPDPTGNGAVRAINFALEDAGVKPEQVAYLNLHGTGTVNNDAMESRAVEKALGLEVPCSSTKPFTGHLLGAAGAFEAALCYSVIEDNGMRCLPVHRWDGVLDEDLPGIRLVGENEPANLSDEQVVLSSSFAFGGSNCCLALGRGR